MLSLGSARSLYADRMTSRFTAILLSAALLLGSGAASAAPEQPTKIGTKEVGISYAANGGIRDWHAEDERGIYLRDRAGRWYYARFSHPCFNLPSLQSLVFSTDPATGRFDHFSTVGTGQLSCDVASVVRSEPPAAKGGKVSK